MMLGWETLNRALQKHVSQSYCFCVLCFGNTGVQHHIQQGFITIITFVCAYVVLETSPMVFHILSSALP